ncbi:MarR family winged helix-turn-helix transcriptional regulator [Novosphingobium cyanobacteriorum]|uniref:MarR family winged helix-turn-helix transcriptional regulator n=1 Tax=Novosphingobium cyanobacteriorum TaxID=3024215 RepID=A0ABT6CMP6_9SPHN|nr:MarR family winged helix-turn-helix transcriptional regulator [Novosphingobium cyanobacteriorum]MDF8335186.1 MarR family winged helix-turn-helix transcriptional regulator [Novosphingobium cyanobacteriorum]
MPDIEKDKLQELADIVQKLTQSIEGDGQYPNRTVRQNFLKEARQELRRRSLKRSVFKEIDFNHEWAWDILLELYVSHCTGSAVNPTSAGADAGIAQSTALRWIGVLEAAGLVRRRPDTLDKRRQWIGLTREGVKRMESYFQSTG